MKARRDNPKAWLEAEFLVRRAKNPHYSLRAFARQLDIPAGRLSQLLSQKRKLTLANAQRIAANMDWEPKKAARFLRLVQKHIESQKRGGVWLAKRDEAAPSHTLSQDQFQTIAEPFHYELLSLMETDDFESDISWMARRLGRSVVEVRAALERLERLGLVKQEKQNFVLTKKGISVDSGVRSTAIRRAHAEVIDHAKETIEGVQVQLRDISSMTLAVDPQKLPEAFDIIKEFRRRFTSVMESGPKREVYRLNVQFVPVSKFQYQAGDRK